MKFNPNSEVARVVGQPSRLSTRGFRPRAPDGCSPRRWLKVGGRDARPSQAERLRHYFAASSTSEFGFKIHSAKLKRSSRVQPPNIVLGHVHWLRSEEHTS